ncbi:MAG TPA: fatty acid desaturase [Myxococcales bacterium]|nr:fatty acid desaturase [Myxococcales bacterium]
MSAPLDLAPFSRPLLARSLWQLLSTAVPLGALWWVMAETAPRVPWAVTWLGAVPAGLLLFRLFMIQHDCGHGSFFRSRLANDVAGTLIGVTSNIPYHYWRRTHALHHANSSRLEGRDELGSLVTLTVREYRALPRWKKALYRAYRHPLGMVGVGAVLQLQLKHRFPWDTPRRWRREWAGIFATNLAFPALLGLLALRWGWGTVLEVEVPILLVTGWFGVWMIYMQHVFPGGWFARDGEWSLQEASLRGSSYYRLPRVLRWLTADVGLHHVHHLGQQVPNYRLQEAMDANPELAAVKPISLWESRRCWDCQLWDEDAGRFVKVPAGP